MDTSLVLVWRQLLRFSRTRSRLVSALCQPIFYLASLGFGLGSIIKPSTEISYLQFLVPGIIGMSVLYPALYSGGDLIWDRQFGYLKAVMVAPVSRLSIMWGRTLAGATTTLIQTFLVVLACLIVGARIPHLGRATIAVMFLVLIALLFTALGTTIGSIVTDFQGFNLTMNFLVLPMFMFSGALYPLERAPKALQHLAAFDPFAYGVDGIRYGINGGPMHFGLPADLLVLCGTLGVSILIGTRLLSKGQY